MKRVHNIRFSALSKDHEEREAIKRALLNLLETEELPFEQEDLKESGMDTIHSLTVVIDKQPMVRTAIQRITVDLSPEERRTLAEQVDTRIDARGNFWYRLDKQAFIEGTSRFVERGDVVQVRLSVAAFPKNHQTVKGAVLELLGQAQTFK